MCFRCSEGDIFGANRTILTTFAPNRNEVSEQKGLSLFGAPCTRERKVRATQGTTLPNGKAS